MRENLKILIKMQEIDDVIGEKTKVKEKLPKELDDLIQNAKLAAETLETTKKQLDNNLVVQKSKTNDIQQNNDRIAKYENQLLTVKTNKEYKALNSEIAGMKQKNTSIDEELIKLMDEESEIRENLSNNKDQKQAADKVLLDREGLLKKKMDDMENEIAELRTKRNNLAVNLPKTLIKRYATLIKNRNRKAVVFNENKACSGCGFQIRPQLEIEIFEGKTLVSCESCGRMLVNKELGN